MWWYTEQLNGLTEKILKTNLINQHLDSVYHYTSADAFCSIVESQKLRFTNKKYLNDAAEETYALDLCIMYAENICNRYPWCTDEFRNECEWYKQNLTEFPVWESYQCSFSIDPDSLCLWNYYTHGDSIKGYNIEFDSQKLCDEINNTYQRKNFVSANKVIYDTKRQIEMIRLIANLYFDMYYQNRIYFEHINEERERCLSATIERLVKSLWFMGQFFKRECFKVESEYRIIFYHEDVIVIKETSELKGKGINKPDLNVHYFTRNGVAVPYIDIAFSPNTLKSVTLSPTLDSQIAKAGAYSILREKNYPSVSMGDIKTSKIPVRF